METRPARSGLHSQGEEQVEPSLLTATQIEEIQRQAFEEAYERGKKEGFEYGHREALEAGHRQVEEEKVKLHDKSDEFTRLLRALDTPFEELDGQVEAELVILAIALVKQLVRREIKTDPGQIVAVVREALGALPVVARNIRLHLHPDDATLVREAVTMNESEQSWTIVDDPMLTRGGCRVVTETSRIEATLEARLNALIARVFGGERVGDERPE